MAACYIVHDISWHLNYYADNDNGATTTWRMKFSGYIGHVTTFSWMLTSACCLVVRLRVRVKIRLSILLVSGYAHEFILLSVVIVTLPYYHYYYYTYMLLYCCVGSVFAVYRGFYAPTKTCSTVVMESTILRVSGIWPRQRPIRWNFNEGCGPPLQPQPPLAFRRRRRWFTDVCRTWLRYSDRQDALIQSPHPQLFIAPRGENFAWTIGYTTSRVFVILCSIGRQTLASTAALVLS